VTIVEYEQLHAAVKALDPAPRDAELPDGLWSPAIALRDIDTRSGPMTKTGTRPETTTPAPRWRPALVAAAAFIGVIAIGAVVWLAATRDTAPPVDQTTSTTEAQTTTTVTIDKAVGPEPITTRSGSVEAGTYSLDTLGTPIVFTVENPVFFVQENSSGYFVMSAANSQGPDDRDMVMIRLAALSDPSAPNASVADQGEGWPADDFDGWLDNLTDGVVATNREATTLGGLPATRVDLELGDIECLPGTSNCVLFDLTQRKPLNPGSMYRIWVVNQGLDTPIAVILGSAGDASDASWRAAFEQVLSTMEFRQTP
jgi:hypothetical protein